MQDSCDRDEAHGHWQAHWPSKQGGVQICGCDWPTISYCVMPAERRASRRLCWTQVRDESTSTCASLARAVSRQTWQGGQCHLTKRKREIYRKAHVTSPTMPVSHPAQPRAKAC